MFGAAVGTARETVPDHKGLARRLRPPYGAVIARLDRAMPLPPTSGYWVARSSRAMTLLRNRGTWGATFAEFPGTYPRRRSDRRSLRAQSDHGADCRGCGLQGRLHERRLARLAQMRNRSQRHPVQIPAHRGQSFRRIADSIPVIADSF